MQDARVVEVGALRRHARAACTSGIGLPRVTPTAAAAGYLVWQAIAILESSARPDHNLPRSQQDLLWMLWTAVVGQSRDGVIIDNVRRLAMITHADVSLSTAISSLGEDREDWDAALSATYRNLMVRLCDRIARAIAKADIDSIAVSLPTPRLPPSGNPRTISAEHRWNVARSLAAIAVPRDAVEAAIQRATICEARLERARLLYSIRVELDARATVGAAVAALVATARSLDARENVGDEEVARFVEEVLDAAA